MIVKLCDVPAVNPVAVLSRRAIPVPYWSIHVAVISVENVTIALIVHESATLVLSGIDTRSRITEVAPVFPARSVATIATVLSPPVRSYTGLDQLSDPRVAARPFTTTLATHPVSVTVPVRVGTPVTISLST